MTTKDKEKVTLISIAVPDSFLREILDNLPEASQSFDCISWDYSRTEFKLVDRENGKEYTLDMPKTRKGFRYLTKKVLAGELPGLGLSIAFLSDASAWDSYSIDALLQSAVLGDVIYG